MASKKINLVLGIMINFGRKSFENRIFNHIFYLFLDYRLLVFERLLHHFFEFENQIR